MLELEQADDERCSLAGALKGAEIVVIPAGVPRKPGMTWVVCIALSLEMSDLPSLPAEMISL